VEPVEEHLHNSVVRAIAHRHIDAGSNDPCRRATLLIFKQKKSRALLSMRSFFNSCTTCFFVS